MKAKYLYLLLLLGILSSCEDQEVEAPNFNVSVVDAEVQIGDSARFSFSGDPDIITFYSGENGNEYKNRERTELTGGKLELEFINQVLYGTQVNNLRLVASTDFSGTYTPEEVAKATWVDISDRFTWSTGSGLGPIVNSGKKDITDLLVSGKPIYLAFKYVGEKPAGTSPTQRTWRIHAFNVTNSFENGSTAPVATLTTAGWTSVDFLNPASKWVYTSTLVYFNPFSTLEASEEWAISKPLNPNKVSPDRGTPIKEYTLSKPTHSYAYSAPGTYTATFVASNVHINGQKTVVKEVEVTVLP
ncbi:DUF5017 domain-containing protein [Rufibacter roseus]|uniref:DUF5017 domain-containing protein n=1 Tax=Rufibacter roseus TaxID=1567108 RepID=A0ABW2DH89_9BACT|nr:DUF5017 domain-containing protein [Rufibacter roseus]